MSTDKNQGDDEARDDDGRDEDEALEGGEGAEQAGPQQIVARNRAERRAAAKAARRGRAASTESGDAVIVGVEAGGQAVTATPAAAGARRPKVPPRTMTRGTGDVDGVPDWVRRIGVFISERRAALAGGTLAAIVVVGGIVGWQTYTVRRESRAFDAYADALDVLRAPIRTDDAPDPDTVPPRRGPRFHSLEERTRASVEKLRQVEQRFPQSRIAPLARLGEATALYELGRYDEAKQVYRSLLGADVAGLEGRVLEGLGFAMESTGDLDGAMAKYRDLQTVENGTYRDAAQYYQARLLARRGDAARSKEILHGLIERLGRITAGDPTAAASSELRDESYALLRDVDPTDPALAAREREGGETSGQPHRPGSPQGISPEMLQQLLHRAQSKQGTGH